MAGEKPRYLDLFAGAGGLSEGFIRAGFDPVAHIEMDQDACKTLETRMIYHALAPSGNLPDYKEYMLGKIDREFLVEKFNLQDVKKSVICATIGQKNVSELIALVKSRLGDAKLDVIVGGPPCQAYSNIGRARDDKGMKWDRRKFLYRYYVDFLRAFKPKYFVFENVPGLLSSGKGLYLKMMTRAMQEVGYCTDFKKINAARFGVPQNRKRIIFVGWRSDLKNASYPEMNELSRDYKVADFLQELPSLNAGGGEMAMAFESPSKLLKELGIVNNAVGVLHGHIARPHRGLDLKIYKLAVNARNEGKSIKYSELPSELRTHKKQDIFLDRFKVIDLKADASHTVVAHISKDGHYYIHPDIVQNRSLTVREAARLQTFPDDFVFEGSRTSQFKQVGNAVPPMLAHAIAQAIHKQIVPDP